MLEDLKLIELGEFTSLITSVKVSHWGNQVNFDCLYNPHGNSIHYQLIFQNCQDIEWSIHSPENCEDLEADIIDFQIGLPSYQKPAIIYTDIFEISINYGSLKVEKLSEESSHQQQVILNFPLKSELSQSH